MTQLRTVQVLGGGSAGSSAHVRSLAAGLVARGVRVTVCAPAELERDYDFLGAGRALRARSRGAAIPAAVARAAGRLRRAPTSSTRTGCTPPYGPPLALARAGRRAAGRHLAHPLARRRGARPPAAACWSEGPSRAAAVVLGTSSDLVDRARSRGARDARLAAVAVPAPRPPGRPPDEQGAGRTGRGGPAVADGRGQPRRAPRLRRAAGRGPHVARSRPGAAARHRGRGPGAGRAAAPYRGARRCPSGSSAGATTSPNCWRPPTSRCCPAAGRPARCSPRRRCASACRWSPRRSAGCPSWWATRRRTRPVRRRGGARGRGRTRSSRTPSAAGAGRGRAGPGRDLAHRGRDRCPSARVYDELTEFAGGRPVRPRRPSP